MPKYQAEDFSIASAAQGDNSTRAVKSLAEKGGYGMKKIVAARSAWTFFQSHFFASAKQTAGESMEVEGEASSSKPDAAPLRLADSAAAWKKLTPEEKQPFEEMAKKDRERYKKEMVARDEEALKEQEARRSAKDDIIERARPKYISKKMIDARKRAAENALSRDAAQAALQAAEAADEAAQARLADAERAHADYLATAMEALAKKLEAEWAILEETGAQALAFEQADDARIAGWQRRVDEWEAKFNSLQVDRDELQARYRGPAALTSLPRPALPPRGARLRRDVAIGEPGLRQPWRRRRPRRRL